MVVISLGVIFALLMSHVVQSDSSEQRGFDTSQMYSGVMQSENIAVHVIQNLVNFLASTLVWGLFIPGFGVGFH